MSVANLRLAEAGTGAPAQFDFELDTVVPEGAAAAAASVPASSATLRILNLDVGVGTASAAQTTVFDDDDSDDDDAPLAQRVLPADAEDALRNRFVARIDDRQLAADYTEARLAVEALRNATPPDRPLQPSLVAAEATLARLAPAVNAAVRPVYVAELRAQLRAFAAESKRVRTQQREHAAELGRARARIVELNAHTLRAHAAYETNNSATPQQLERLADQLSAAERSARAAGTRLANARARLAIVAQRLEQVVLVAAASAPGDDDAAAGAVAERVAVVRTIVDSIRGGAVVAVAKLSDEQRALLGSGAEAADYAAAVRIGAEIGALADAYTAARDEVTRLSSFAALLGASYRHPRAPGARVASNAHTLDAMRQARERVRAHKRRMYTIEQESRVLRARAADIAAEADATRGVIAAVVGGDGDGGGGGA